MQTVSFAGDTYNIPTVRGDRPWSGLSDFVVAAASKCINTAGGNFTLLANINFGATFGLVSAFYTSRTANAASAGALRLANTDTIKFRNGLNDANLSLAIATNRLTFEGSRLIIAGAAEIVNADISASAAIAYSKLNLATSIVNADLSASAAIAFSKLAALASGNILVGSAGTVPTSVPLSGDATLVASGALTLATVNSNVGSFTHASITVNAKGLVTAASSGSGGVTSVSGTANQITSTGGATPVLALASPLTTPGAVTVTGNVTFTPTTAGIVGTTTNDNTAAGNVGEVISGTRLRSAASSISSGTVLNVASIALTNGDWDIRAMLGYTIAGNSTQLQGGISTTSATLSGADTIAVPDSVGQVRVNFQYTSGSVTGDTTMAIPASRASVTGGPVTYYLCANATISTSTVSAYGSIVARRVR